MNAKPKAQPEPLWRTEDLAAYLSLAPGTVRNLRTVEGALPPAAVLGRNVRWDLAVVHSWVLEQTEAA